MLTSTANERIKHAIRVREGRERGLLFAEGERLIEELAASGLEIKRVFHAAEPTSRTSGLLQRLRDDEVECLTASEAVLKALSDTVQTQGIIALAERPAAATLESIQIRSKPLLVALDAVQDPGNVGTILRTAEAAGAAAAIPLAGSADVFAPKVLRSAMGSAFRLPVLAGIPVETLFSWAKNNDVRVVAAAGSGAVIHTSHDWTRPTLLILGNEAKGVSPTLLERCDVRVRVPMRAPVESLNVATAAAVLLFEAARQRGY